jgi:hypothetical protein
LLFPKLSRFANLTPVAVFLILASVLTVAAYGLISPQLNPVSGDDENIKGEDLRCYRGIVERIHTGEGYYEAAGSELRARGYPTRSVFNWRLPLLAWVMGHLPSILICKGLAIILGLVILIIWAGLLQEEPSFWQMAVGSLLVLGPTIYSLLPDVFLAHEFWAGAFITLSLVGYARGFRVLSVASGLLALFIRELTLPFIGVMLILAYAEGRRREGLAWICGLVAFGIILLFHWAKVTSLVMAGDLTPAGWIAYGGWAFVLSTAQMHPYLFLAPLWVTPLLLPFILFGFAGWRGPLGLRFGLTIGAYILAYSFVGKPFNKYWGLMYTNILPLGLLYVSSSMRDLWRSARRNSG